MSELICVTNRTLCSGDFLRRIEQIAQAKSDRIILREKDLSDSDYAALAEPVMEICRKYGVICTLHGHPEAALRLGAKSVHLPDIAMIFPALASVTGTLFSPSN